VLLLDPDDRVLLVAHVPATDRRVWTAPGGGLRTGEDHVAAARRELKEELDLDVEPGAWIWSRREVFTFRGVWLDQSERWFLARAPAIDAAAAPLDDPGTTLARWWTLDELATTTESLAPAALHQHVTSARARPAGGPPDDRALSEWRSGRPAVHSCRVTTMWTTVASRCQAGRRSLPTGS
jgi:ADP-ribose pyrophosphatase YjhB (NUDIX family)